MPRIEYDVTGVSVFEPEPETTVRRDLPDPTKLQRWHRDLLASPAALAVLADRYGLTPTIIREYELGLEQRRSGPWIAIPVRGGYGRLINVRSR